MKLLGVIAASFFVLGSLYFSIRFWGQAQRYEPYSHPMMTPPPSQPHWIIGAKTPEEARNLLNEAPEVWIHLDVQMSADQVLFLRPQILWSEVLTPETLDSASFRGDRNYFYSFSFLQSLGQTQNKKYVLYRLEEALSSAPGANFIIETNDNAKDIHLALIKIIKDLDLSQKVILHSEIDSLQKALKSEAPTWVFGMSLSERVRFLTLDTIGLSSATQLRGDYWISKLSLKGRPQMNFQILDEIHRRHKRIALGPIESPSELEIALGFKPHFLIADSWSAFQKLK